MISAIKTFFEQNISTTDETATLEHQLKLATAALLVEMMQQDHHVDDAERQAVKQTIMTRFDLGDDESQALLDLAQKEAEEAVDYHQFTSLIAREYSQDQKIRLIENLWSIAYADGHLDALEEHMIRRIADLIYVPHRDFIQSKHRVKNAAS